MSASAVYDRMSRDLKTFTVTGDHLKLLRRAFVDWQDMEFGAPAIDPKRPYGNSDVLGDLVEILHPEIYEEHQERDTLHEYVEEHEQELVRLHAETAIVLQIAIGVGEFKPGEYRRVGYGSWERAAGEAK